jgi:hypothetical protein
MRLVLSLLAAAPLLLADGGAVILHEQTNNYVVTVFASPAPPRAGIVDLSVLLQSAAAADPVLDADIWIRLDNGGTPITVHATRARAGNKLLYAASAPLVSPGPCHYSVSIARQAAERVLVSGVFTVLSPQPKLFALAAFIALPFFCFVILALHQWLRLRAARPPTNQQIQIS